MLFFIGGNDIRDARSQSEKEFAYSLIDTASDALEAQLSILLAAGAKSVLVVNGPDIGRVPETRILATALQNPNLVKFSSKISKRFNKNLKKSVKSLEKTFSVDIVDFNFFDTLNLIIKNNLALGFNNATDACFSFVNLSFYPGCDSSFFATNVFFDELHLTARSHERIGRAMYAVVPEVL